MNTRRHGAANYLLYTLAFIWPLEVFQYIPRLNVNATALIAVILVFLMIYDSFKGERLRVPFELLWPVTLLLVLVVIIFVRGIAAVPFHVPATIGLFVATVHFARSQEAIESWLRAGLFSGAIVSALTFATPLAGNIGILPTAYSLRTGATLTFAYDIRTGIQMLAIWIVTGAMLLYAGSKRASRRRWTAIAVLAISVCLVQAAFKEFSAGVAVKLPRYMDYPGTVLAALCLVLWLTARVAAKVEVSRRESAAGKHVLLLLIVGVMAGWVAVFPSVPALFQAYLLGLVCAYVVPDKGAATTVALPKIGLAMAAVLMLSNLTSVHSEHVTDPRNYEAAARSDFEKGRLDTLRSRMDYFGSLQDAERRTHFWLARAALAEGRHEAASFAFRMAMAEANGQQLLPGPSEEEQRNFLVRLRDYCSALPNPEATAAYERASLAAGDMNTALESLRLRVRTPGIEAPDLDPAPLAAAVAFMLGDYSPARAFDGTRGQQGSTADSQISNALMGWPTRDLLTVLAQWGVEISRAPAGFPSAQLPLVLVAGVGGRAPVILGRTREAGLEHSVDNAPGRRVTSGAGGGAAVGWSALAVDDGGQWTAGLQLPRDGDSTVLVRVTFDSDGSLSVDVLEAWPNGLAYAPVARIWLP